MANNVRKENKKKSRLPLLFGGLLAGAGVVGGTALTIISLNREEPVSNVSTITFNANGGYLVDGTLNKVMAENGKSFGSIIKPEARNEGYHFAFWSHDSTGNSPISDTEKIKGSMTIYAHYVAVSLHTINFKTGTSGASIVGNPVVVSDGEVVKFNEINKPKAINSTGAFVCWSKTDGANDPIGEDEEIGETIDLYPFFGPKPTSYVTITFNANGGNPLQGLDHFDTPTDVIFGSMSKPIATKKGKDFKEWTYDTSGNDPVGPDAKFDEPTTLYAQYKDVDTDKKVTCSLNGTKCWLSNPTATSGDLIFIDPDGEQIKRQRDSFNETITFGDDIDEIDVNFLYGCSSFNNGATAKNDAIDLKLPANLLTIGDSFLNGCSEFNQKIDLSKCAKLTYIGASFLQLCTTFNSNIVWPVGSTVEELFVGSFFLQYCTTFNQEIRLPDNVLVIPHSFMCECIAFNNGVDAERTEPKPFYFPKKLGKIESYFLSDCISFNQAIDLSANTVVSIAEDFLYGCLSFNNTLKLSSKITTISTGFLTACESFNQPLTFPSGLTTIGDVFMYGCYRFNQTITLTNTVIKNIGQSFMSYCYNYNKDLTIPNTIQKVGSYFMRDCSAYTSTITLNCRYDCFEKSDYTLSSGSMDEPCVQQGIKLKSSIVIGIYNNVAWFKDRFKDHTQIDPPFRKLINAN